MNRNDLAVGELVKALVADHGANRAPGDGIRYFEDSMVGFASGADPLFVRYLSIIGGFHMTPAEVLAEAGEDAPSDPAGITVVCWILPVSRPVRESNRERTDIPSRLWAHCRQYGERFNDVVRGEVEDYFRKRGIPAAAPYLGDRAKVHTADDGRILGANWSERHAAFAAGLGSFSLNDGFITPRGIAMRCGSVVAAVKPERLHRGHPNHREQCEAIRSHTRNCLFCSEGSCGDCIRRCPAGAITVRGHDRQRCSAYIDDVVRPRTIEEYGIHTPGCGLCQTGVPCEFRIP